MSHKFISNGIVLEYELTRSKRRTVGIAVKPGGWVHISAPAHLAMDRIEQVVKTKLSWILRKKAELEKLELEIQPKSYIKGETFLYLGESYPLKIREGAGKSTRVGIHGGELQVFLKPSVDKNHQMEGIRQAIAKWYREQARLKIVERLEYYSSRTGMHANKVAIKEQKTRWGSCSRENNLNFNWKIIMAPLPVLDYLVVHELCHIKEKNHSKRYWSLVESILPNYKQERLWLKNNGLRLNL